MRYKFFFEYYLERWLLYLFGEYGSYELWLGLIRCIWKLFDFKREGFRRIEFLWLGKFYVIK